MLNKYIQIILFLISNLISGQNSAEYVIFTISDYQESANLISSIHNSYVSPEYRLSTKVVFLDEFEWYDINDFNLNKHIRQEILNQANTTKYLLLLGNEVDIPPIYIVA